MIYGINESQEYIAFCLSTLISSSVNGILKNPANGKRSSERIERRIKGVGVGEWPCNCDVHCQHFSPSHLSPLSVKPPLHSHGFRFVVSHVPLLLHKAKPPRPFESTELLTHVPATLVELDDANGEIVRVKFFRDSVVDGQA